MIFIERKVFIEYLDRTTIKMTTPLRQNVFEIDKMKEEQIIDLIELKVKPRSGCEKFFAIVDRYRDIDCDEPPINGLEIYANGSQLIQEMYFGDGDKLIKTKIFEND